MKGYPHLNPHTNAQTRPPPKDRSTVPTTAVKTAKRTSTLELEGEPPAKKQANVITMLHVEEMPTAEEQHEDTKADQVCQTSNVTELKRNLFIEQATREENCYRYTGLPKEKLDLIFNTVKCNVESYYYTVNDYSSRSCFIVIFSTTF